LVVNGPKGNTTAEFTFIFEQSEETCET